MDWQSLLQSIDCIIQQQTGKHLTNIQSVIIKGVINGQRYTTIAQEYGCTIGHIKDTSYKLWQILTLAFGETIHKNNIRAALERRGLIPIPHSDRCDRPKP